MKKIIIALLMATLLTMALVSCSCEGMGNGGNGTDTNKKDTTDTTNSAGSITETGTDTNIVDRVESMITGSDTTTK